jgi:tetratricopeptide (TPR) repeat protein
MAEAMHRQMLHSASDPDTSYAGPRRRRVGGWIVALVLLGGVGILGFIVAKPYLTGAAKPVASSVPLDEKTQQYLTDGEKALADGNLDTAKENFDKASARAEKDARVLLDVARLAAARADVPWLRSRILPADATDDARATKAALEDLSAAARRAADEALAVAPDEPAALRAKIDASRIGGERDTARKLVAKVIAQAQQPETAYVLAALDLAEPEPLWSTVIERLRLAAQGEGNAGRARAALVYALARSGDKAGAKAELEKLAALTRPHPLVGPLRSFVDKSVAKAIPDAGADGAVPTIAVSQLPNAPPGMAGVGEQPIVLTGSIGQGMQALAHGDKDKARQIFEGLVARNPNDSEALTGLGDVARASGDTNGAIGYYKRALSVNPSYLHALLALADTYYATGNRGEAIRLYHDVMDRFPEQAYPAYVKQRAEGGGAPPPAATSAAPAASAPPPAPSPAPPAPAPTPKASDGF